MVLESFFLTLEFKYKTIHTIHPTLFNLQDSMRHIQLAVVWGDITVGWCAIPLEWRAAMLPIIFGGTNFIRRLRLMRFWLIMCGLDCTRVCVTQWTWRIWWLGRSTDDEIKQFLRFHWILCQSNLTGKLSDFLTYIGRSADNVDNKSCECAYTSWLIKSIDNVDNKGCNYDAWTNYERTEKGLSHFLCSRSGYKLNRNISVWCIMTFKKN